MCFSPPGDDPETRYQPRMSPSCCFSPERGLRFTCRGYAYAFASRMWIKRCHQAISFQCRALSVSEAHQQHLTAPFSCIISPFAFASYFISRSPCSPITSIPIADTSSTGEPKGMAGPSPPMHYASIFAVSVYASMFQLSHLMLWGHFDTGLTSSLSRGRALVSPECKLAENSLTGKSLIKCKDHKDPSQSARFTGRPSNYLHCILL